MESSSAAHRSLPPPPLPTYPITHTHTRGMSRGKDGGALRCSGLQLSLSVFYFIVCLCIHCTHASALHRYTHQELLDIGYRHKVTVSTDFHNNHNMPDEPARLPDSPWIVVGSGKRCRRRRERNQKPGRRSGLLLRLKSNPHKPPLPSQYLTNARSIPNRTDDLDLQLTGNRSVRDCCVLIITETWFHPKIPDASMQLTGRSLHR